MTLFNHAKKILFSLAVTGGCVVLTSCYNLFETKVPMDFNTPVTTLTDFFHEEKEELILRTPTQLFVSQGLYSDKIVLSWNECENATSYRIERAVKEPDSEGKYSEPEENDFEILQEYVYNTTYNDKILTTPTATSEEYTFRYYYRVSAENIRKGLESSPFTDYKAQATNGKGWLLPAPTNLVAWKGKSTNEIKLTWNSVPNTKYYKIYRGVNSNGTSMEHIDTVLGSQTSYVNTVSDKEQGTEFYYKICAQVSGGDDSAFSGLALGYSLKPGAPDTPSGLSVLNGMAESTTSLTVTWGAINYVDPTNTKTLTYSVFRTSSEDSVYTLLKSGLDSSTTSFTDSAGLKPGLIYYYYVQAIAVDGTTGEKIQSAFSETGPDDAEPCKAFLLSYPSFIEVNDGSSASKSCVRWTPSLGFGESGISFTYNIFSSNNLEGPYIAVSTQILPELGSDGYYQVELDKKTFFKISATNGTGTESSLSEAVAPCPQAPQNVLATKTCKLDDGDFKANNFGVYPVKITWNKPDGEDPSGYHVYRSTKKDADFRKITTAPVTVLTYIDNNETAKAGTYYYYKVISLNSLGQGRNGNNPANGNDACGYGALTAAQWFREYNKTIKASQKKLTLMHKSKDTDKLGSETINGKISGTLSYNAALAGLGAEITMHYSNYADFYISNKEELGVYFLLNGNTDTSSNMSGNGNMHESVDCSGMYPGVAYYNKLEIKSGAAGGGTYGVTTRDLNGSLIFNNEEISWTVGNE